MIPDDVISQIRDAADIIQVIGQHVQLRKAGRNWKGLCPFHGEKTPSFNVSPDKGFFHCFGCQKHGDVFTFVMELEGKSFVDAAEQLAQRFGIAVPRIEESPELRKQRGERVAMLELNKLATAFYREVLADPTRGEAGRAYLAKRGVSDETAARFQLGYAPVDWGALADHLKAQRADLELAVKVGLIAPRPRSGGYYDRNRDRLVCPVVVPGGDVVGFSSRVVGSAPPPPAGDGSEHNEPPKYINSPESTVYKKSKLLFGLAQAREAMAVTKRVVLVEGNFDVITLHQAGFTDVVAPLGTALTPEQVGVLRRVAERVVLLYDGDRAGYKATMHALQMCVEQDVEVLVASSPGHGKSGGLSGPLTGGVDPDSLVAGGGAELLREAIDRAKGAIEYFAFEVWSKARGNVDARARALEDAARLVAKVASPMKRDLIVATLATAMDVDVGVVRNAIARSMGHGPQGSQGPYGGSSGSHGAGSQGSHGGSSGSYGGSGGSGGAARTGSHLNALGGDAASAGSRPSPVLPAPPADEVEVISLLSDHPSLIATAEADKAFWLLTDARLRDMYSAARAGQSLLELAASGHLPPSITVHLLSGKYADSKDPRVELLAMTRNLEVRKSGAGLAELKKLLADATRRGDRELARQLSQLAEAERKGDRELVARLREGLEAETSNGKQVD
ncbi:MAG: DNA primase [Myxococcota bacterium]|nr:DNA primase [Myxococcota bacterium]